MSTSPRPALDELLAHTRWVEELARSLVRDRDSAGDLAQSTMLAALEARDSRRGNLRAWLAKILRNQVRERGRRESARGRIERDGSRAEALPATDELVQRAESERRVVAAVLALDEPHRGTLLLRYFEDLSPEEIARRSNTSLATVASRITRAHARLRERLSRDRADANWLAALAPIVARSRSTAAASSSGALSTSRIPTMSAAAKFVALSIVVALAAWWAWPKSASKSDLVASSASSGASIATNSPAPKTVANDAPVAPPIESRRDVELPREASADAATPTAPAAVAASGGRIFGQIFRLDGRPAAKRKIRMLVIGAGVEKFVTTGDDGRFDERELAAGTWALSTYPDADELAALGITLDSPVGGMLYLRQRTIDLERGMEVEVVLGKPPVDAVHVHGRLLVDGAPVDGFMTWFPDGRDAIDRQQLASATAAKGFEVLLDQAARYDVVVIQQNVRVEFAVDVPKTADFEHDFALPSHGLHGRVASADGRPVVGAHVDLVPSAALAPRQPTVSINFSPKTDANGEFSFRSVAPARYSIGVHGGTIGEEKLAASAATLRDILVDANTEPSALSIVVATGVRVKGVLHDPSGRFASDCVFVFAENGDPLNALDAATSDANGAFELFALAPGRYFVVAAGGESWSRVQNFVVPTEGGVAPLELVLESAAKLSVDVHDREPGSIDLRDSNHCSFAGLLDKHVFDRAKNRDWSTSSFAFRVPAGAYDVALVRLDGVAASTQVALAAGETKVVELGK